MYDLKTLCNCQFFDVAILRVSNKVNYLMATSYRVKNRMLISV